MVGQAIGGLAPVEVTGVHREEQQEPRGRISLAQDSTVTSLTDHLRHPVTPRSSWCEYASSARVLALLDISQSRRRWFTALSISSALTLALARVMSTHGLQSSPALEAQRVLEVD